jgi:hypothetical protein
MDFRGFVEIGGIVYAVMYNSWTNQFSHHVRVCRALPERKEDVSNRK